jgi:hypothetical protein
MATDYKDRLRIPLEGNDYTSFETKTGLHVATGYARIVVGGRGPYVEFLPGHLIWDSLQIPDQEKYRLEHPWKDKVFYVEWRTKDQSNVKVYEQKRTVDCVLPVSLRSGGIGDRLRATGHGSETEGVEGRSVYGVMADLWTESFDCG